MSNTAINIRVWYWHWQVTFDNEWSWSVNKYIYGKHRKTLWKRPFAIYDFYPWKIKRGKK